MKLLDLNILLYAVNTDSPLHGRARAWVEETFAGDDAVLLPWVVILGFLRLATGRQVFTRPIGADAAVAIVDGWLSRPNVVALNPGPEHWPVLRGLLAASGSAGNLTTDAHLATLAIEQGCDLCSTDADFARFSRLRWINPLLAPPSP